MTDQSALFDDENGERDTAAVLQSLADDGVDLDPRGNTCWWVLVHGEPVGWVRRTLADTYHAVVPGYVDRRWKQRRGRNARIIGTHDFDVAVRFVVDNARGPVTYM